jgi:hypothetical protein
LGFEPEDECTVAAIDPQVSICFAALSGSI